MENRENGIQVNLVILTFLPILTDGLILFYQGNNDHGKTWYITQQEVLWKDGKPYLK